LALAIVLTAVIPLAAAVVLARNMVRQTADRFFVPEVRQNIERSLELYAELAKATKATMRLQADKFASDAALKEAVQKNSLTAAKARLEEFVSQNPNVVSLTITDRLGQVVVSADRGSPVDEHRENQLNVRQTLGGAPDSDTASAVPEDTDAGVAAARALAPTSGQRINMVFATDKSRFESFDQMSEFVTAYSKLEARRDSDERTYVLAFAALLGITILLSVAVGTRLAVGVTRRASELALATRLVAEGDLSIRVPEEAKDELGDLARAFNRMLREVESSRDRIEYLSRLASWQEMARRLAHEIKNPLTPIQLAMQEVHERLRSLSPEQKQLLDLAREIIETEVQTLRRLVGEFSEFARLPECHIEETDLVQFLKELEREHALTGQVRPDDDRPSDNSERAVSIRFDLPNGAARAHLDRQMLRRALVNLVANARQASRGRSRPAEVHVTLRRQQDFYELLLDDDGPGVPPALRTQVFEPYVSTKDDGTGLGLAIVKKIVMEHRGHIEMLESPQGGARVRILLPRPDRSSTLVLQHSAQVT
jgi:nitrogen fixation/metabolism regulation signal transduction histidine kinase